MFKITFLFLCCQLEKIKFKATFFTKNSEEKNMILYINSKIEMHFMDKI